MGLACGGAAAYTLSADVQDFVHDLPNRFEDFNDVSREFFESMGDRLCKQKQEPWLLDLHEMKFPETIPTLVLDLDKVVLQLQHDSKQGWHVIKRPFADQFFKELQQYFEIVMFSDDVFPVALEIVTKWQIPVTAVLHRDFCKKKRNHYVKDCSKLGRNLERVLILDHDPAAFQLQPENGILIKPYSGDPDDTELLDLLDFLKAAGAASLQHNQDIRKFVDKWGGGDVDLGRRYLVHKKEQDKKIDNRRGLGRAFSSRPGGLSGGFQQQQFR
jgi:hypothetical protein